MKRTAFIADTAPVPNVGQVSRLPSAKGARRLGRFAARAGETLTLRWLRLVFILHSAFCIFNFALPARAQSGLEEAVFTAATVTTDGTGRHWAYLVWDSTRPGLMSGKQFAVYAKPGLPASPATYERKGVVALQIDPAVITPLLNRSVNLGENLAELTNVVDNLFQSISNIATRPLAEKISLVIRGAAGDPVLETNLRLLAHVHPGVNLCLGTGFADLIGPGDTTFEVRELDATGATERGVIGRVTVTAGAPTILPPPGAPVQFPEANPRGDLNIKLRWATSPELRRLSLLNFGFNIWRINKTFAEVNNYHITPPGPATLHVLQSLNPNEVRRINRVPVLKTKDFDPGNMNGQVADFASPLADLTTYFVADDNDRFDPGGTGFIDGQQFYYFVTARDLLGRDGQTSAGGLAVACRRLPPFAPRDLSVENDYTYNTNLNTSRQVFRLNWKQNTNPAPDNITHYLIYRWTNVALIATNEAYPQSNYVGFVVHNPLTNRATFLDTNVGSPRMPADAGKTFWYTVRAANSNACLGAGLVSPNSSPAYGVLRDRVGPDAPSGFLEVNCLSPMASHLTFTQIIDPAPDSLEYHYVASCSRADSGVSWVEFTSSNSFGTVLNLGRHYYAPGLDNIEVPYAWESINPGTPFFLSCRVGSFNGKVSASATIQFTFFPQPGNARYDYFTAKTTNSAFGGGTHGTPPDPAGPRPSIQKLPDGLINIRFPGVTAGACLIQGSTDLSRWVDVGQVNAVDGLISFTDPLSRTLPYRFYRGVPVNTATTSNCTHVAQVPGSSVKHRVRIHVILRPKTATYKIYRRVDDGPLALIAQGFSPYDPTKPVITRSDDAPPPIGSIVCYYAQLFDRNGNASPLALIGDCTPMTGPLPTPLLSPAEPVGTNTAPQVKLRWYCPPAGVERFRVNIAKSNSAPSGKLTLLNSAVLKTLVSEPAGSVQYVAAPKSVVAAKFPTVALGGISYAKLLADEAAYTPPVGGTTLGPGPNFELTLNVELNAEYTFTVQALRGTDSSLASSPQFFVWSYRPPGPGVPWPARPLPPSVASTTIHPDFRTVVFSNYQGHGQYPVAVRIGEVNPRFDFIPPNSFTPYYLSPSIDPVAYLYPKPLVRPPQNPPANYRPAGDSLLPLALYRIQLANAYFPQVSGDMTQVSPLIEKIAWSRTATNFVGRAYTIGLIQDPFVGWEYDQERSNTTDSTIYGLYLRDTQPVLRGGRYRYLLMRFDRNGEIEKVIHAGDVDIPRSGGF